MRKMSHKRTRHVIEPRVYQQDRRTMNKRVDAEAFKRSSHIKARVRVLPLPLTNFVLGCGLSGIAWVWIQGDQSLANNFVADSSSLAEQVSGRMLRDVEERYAATYMRWAGRKANTLEKWGLFTSQWVEQNEDGIIAWCPRVQLDNTSGFSWGEFEELAQAAYPESGVMIRSGDGLGRSNGTSLWPILYTNPFIEQMIGFDMGTASPRAGSIEAMLATNGTTISELLALDATDQPAFVILQPVYGSGVSIGRIVGCTIKFIKVQPFISDILKGMRFSTKYGGVDVAVFLQVDGGDNNHHLLFDLEGYLNRTSKLFSEGTVTPLEVERRGFKSFSSSVRLTADKAIIVVTSFNPGVNSLTSMFSLVAGCIVSFLVALLVYGRQVQVLSYKDGMEKATALSTFKSRFVADMSHEIRTPLNGIIGTVELLTEERLSPNTEELVSTVQTCSNILMGIVNDALDFSKIEVGELRVEATPAFLRETLLDVITIMRSAYGLPHTRKTGNIRLRLKVAESVPPEKILADEGRVRQVLCNLVSNALKFTDVGSVMVTARCEMVSKEAGGEPLDGNLTADSESHVIDGEQGSRSPLRNARLGSSSEDSTRSIDTHDFARGQTWGEVLRRWLPWWHVARVEEGRPPSAAAGFLRSLKAPGCRRAMLHVEVTDTGIGMTPKQMMRLFKPFSQVHASSDRSVGGTGLGLAISRSLCESMGGTLGCSSTPGVGSTFRFSVLIGVFNTISEMPLMGEVEPNRNAMGCEPQRDAGFAEADGRTVELCIDQEWDMMEETGKKKEPQIRQLVGSRCLKQGREVSRREPVLAGRNELDNSVDGDGGRGHDRRKNGDCLFRTIGTPEASVGTPGMLAEGTTATPRPSDDIWFTAVSSARKKRGQKLLNRETSPAAMLVRKTRPRILIVDDVRVNRMLLRKMLEALDVEVELAEDGEKAVTACCTSRFTMILMDVMMPVMSGFEASGAIRSQAGGLNQETPIIATTASPTLQGSSESGATGITDLLVTPLTRRALFSMVALYATEPEIDRMTAAWVRYTATHKAARITQSAAPRSTLGEVSSTSFVGYRGGASSAKATRFSVVADLPTFPADEVLK